jgi:hypothetical protein
LKAEGGGGRIKWKLFSGKQVLGVVDGLELLRIVSNGGISDAEPSGSATDHLIHLT